MKHVSPILVFLMLLQSNTLWGQGQEIRIADKSITIPQIDAAPKLDGVLDEDIWDQALLVDDLHQVDPIEYATPTQRTEFLLAYDDDNLYIGARLYEDDPSLIAANVLRQGEGLRTDDRIRIVLDPFNDKRSGFHFQANANSVRFDGIYVGSQNDWNWDGIWQSAAKITDYGWSTEVAIPFKTLSFPPDSEWGLNLAREIVRNNETIGWSSRNRTTDPSVAGQLKGITGVTQGKGLDIVPSFSVQDFDSRDTDETDFNTEPSLDVYYKITSALNGALTFNTDFSATEVDSRQVDLSRFSQFFPERRSFFLRESDIFEFGGIGSEGNGTAVSRPDRENARPFFSRRIGLSSSGEPVGLDVGARVTGRIGNWNVGALGIVQEGFEDVDSTNIFVGRGSVKVLGESSLGFVATSGDPRSNLDNSLIGADFRYLNTRLNNGKRLDGNLWYQKTDTEGISGDDAAFGATIRYPSETGWKGGFTAREVQENFNPALGFVSREDVRQYWGDVGYTHRFRDGPLKSVFFGVDGQRARLIDGPLQSESLLVRVLQVDNPVGDEIRIFHNVQTENLLEPFEVSDGVIIEPGSYSFSDTEIVFETSRGRRANIEIGFLTGDFYEGNRNAIDAQVDWRPSKYFIGSLSYAVNFVDIPEGKFDQRILSTNLAAVFNNQLSWVNLIQFDNESNNLGIDSRLHWTPRAGRNIFLVLTKGFNRDEFTDRFSTTETNLTFKIDYTLRF